MGRKDTCHSTKLFEGFATRSLSFSNRENNGGYGEDSVKTKKRKGERSSVMVKRKHPQSRELK